MKRTKLVHKLASAFLAGAMVLSMGGMTSLADEPVIPITDGKIPLTKVVATSSNALYPNTTFTFTVTPEGTANEAIQGETNPVVYGGVTGGAVFASGDNTIAVTPESAAADLKTNITLNASVFTKPGVFRYKVAETAGDYDGMTYDGDYYYLDLYVVNDGTGKKIDGVVAYKVTEGADGKTVASTKSDLTFNNTHTTNTLTVTKIITGNQANMSETFDITIMVTGSAGEKFATNYPENGQNIVLTSGVSKQITLGHNESIIIYGLSEHDTYTVVETDGDAAADGYTASYYTTAYDPANPENGKVIQIEGVAEGTTDKVVNIVNDKSVTTPTGIVLSIAPYILLVALAGVFAVLFLRKRREDF